MATRRSLRWKPLIASSREYTVASLAPYLRNRGGTIFSFGTAVIWPSGVKLSDDDCKRRLEAVVLDPTFTVSENRKAKHFLVTFKGTVGGILSSDLLAENLDVLYKEAVSLGYYDNENLLKAGPGHDQDTRPVVAGLYVRARLNMDAESPLVIAKL